MPGDIKTGFTAARIKDHVGDDIYEGRIEKSVAKMEHDEEHGMDPMIAGAFIGKLALKGCKKPVKVIGFSYRFFVFLSRVLPVRFLNWLIGLLYAS